MILVETFVAGAPKTKGSMEVRNRRTGAMKESVIGSPKWRALMAAAVRDDIARRGVLSEGRGDLGSYPWGGAVAVTVTAYLPPPAGFFERDLYVMAPIWDQAGDLDKIVRNVLDALGTKSRNPKMNGGAIVDDNLVCDLIAHKRVAEPRAGRPQGVWIKVETL